MRAAVAVLVLSLAGGAAVAQDGTGLAPEQALTPETRPEIPVPDESPEPGSSDNENAPAAKAPEADSPIPDDFPQLIPPEQMPPVQDEAASEADDSGTGEDIVPGQSTEVEVEEPAGPPMREVLTETPAELSACLAALDDLGVAYQRADPITDPENPDCGIANSLTVSEIAPGVALDPPPTLRCAAALAAAHWVADVALPLSRKLEGRGTLTAIDQGTGYLCRPRADGEVSEHAFGNAIDVMGFRFESGDPIPVEPRAGDGNLEEAFQRAVRAGACLDFSTVLGPGQEDHADHLHLDIKARDSGFRICQ